MSNWSHKKIIALHMAQALHTENIVLNKEPINSDLIGKNDGEIVEKRSKTAQGLQILRAQYEITKGSPHLVKFHRKFHIYRRSPVYKQSPIGRVGRGNGDYHISCTAHHFFLPKRTFLERTTSIEWLRALAHIQLQF